MNASAAEIEAFRSRPAYDFGASEDMVRDEWDSDVEVLYSRGREGFER